MKAGKTAHPAKGAPLLLYSSPHPLHRFTAPVLPPLPSSPANADPAARHFETTAHADAIPRAGSFPRARFPFQ
jgi:hypothetical protein